MAKPKVMWPGYRCPAQIEPKHSENTKDTTIETGIHRYSNTVSIYLYDHIDGVEAFLTLEETERLVMQLSALVMVLQADKESE